ncbi:MAG: class II aldolase/adducin family protein [Deltaproteobacteria bacterium]|nr:class II aldolase/adducin family protein [Deltaproteobacteria bacterium]
MNESRTRRAVAEVSRLLHERGWVANHDGNVSARVGPDRIVCTPTAISKRLIVEDLLIVVDAEGRLVAGRGRPFSEIGLHLAVYRARRDVGAVVHAHPPHATALGCAGRGIDAMPIAEAVVSLGERIPLVEYATPGPDAVKAVEPFLALHDALLLASHGTIAYGADPEVALLRTELVEHLSRILLCAAPLGGACALPPESVATLLQARAKAGIGPPGRR